MRDELEVERREFLKTACLAGASALLGGKAIAKDTKMKPNILVIVVDEDVTRQPEFTCRITRRTESQQQVSVPVEYLNVIEQCVDDVNILLTVDRYPLWPGEESGAVASLAEVILESQFGT